MEKNKNGAILFLSLTSFLDNSLTIGKSLALQLVCWTVALW